MPSDSQVFLEADQAAVDRGSGVKTTPLAGKWSGSTTITNGFTEFKPGSEIAPHFHNCDESVTVLAGDACCEIDGTEYRLDTIRHTLHDYQRAVEQAGFVSVECIEHRGDEDLVAALPGATKHVGRPLLVIIRARKEAE